MLALVKKPHIELSLHGEGIEELLTWIKKKYPLKILTKAPTDDSIPIESTDFWKKMEKNRVGNLLAAARLKANLTQVELAKKLGIQQNMISDYEHGRRHLTIEMKNRFCKVLKISKKRLS